MDKITISLLSLIILCISCTFLYYFLFCNVLYKHLQFSKFKNVISSNLNLFSILDFKRKLKILIFDKIFIIWKDDLFNLLNKYFTFSFKIIKTIAKKYIKSFNIFCVTSTRRSYDFYLSLKQCYTNLKISKTFTKVLTWYFSFLFSF